MLTTTLALAPAGATGSASADARPYACAAARPSLLPPVAAVRGTGVPTAGMARRRGADITGTGFGFGATGLLTSQQHDPISTNDGTTPLGIHTPGRSTS